MSPCLDNSLLYPRHRDSWSRKILYTKTAVRGEESHPHYSSLETEDVNAQIKHNRSKGTHLDIKMVHSSEHKL